MAVVTQHPLTLPGDSAAANAQPGAHRPRASYALWGRWLPWTAPRLALGPNVRPRTRLELALCALFRCQAEWPASRLIERLAQAPLDSDDNLELVGSTDARRRMSLGRGAAWDVLRDWLEQGMVTQVPPACSASARSTAVLQSRAATAGDSRPWPAHYPG
jgi:hypothetical protein